MRETHSTIEKLEEEINKVFDKFRGKAIVRSSEFLKELDMSPVCGHIFKTYRESWRFRHNPKVMLKATLFMRLKGIKFQTQLIKYLGEHQGDAMNLGCIRGKSGKVLIPSRRAFNHFMNERITKDAWAILSFAERRIREESIKRGILLDFRSLDEKSRKSVSKRTFFRRKQKKVKELCKLMRKTIYPQIDLEIAHNAVYKKTDFLDLITHVALTHDFAENGSATMKMVRDKSPDGDTLLYHIKKYGHRAVIEDMFRQIFDMTFEMAKKSNFLNKPVDLAIDYTEIPYYGDRHDFMVVGTKPGRGTTWAFKFATVNIVNNGERYMLYAIPVSVGTPKVKVVRELLRYARGKVRIRKVYMDRGFFGLDVIEYLNRSGIRFVMPAVRNWRIQRVMEKARTPYVCDYKMLGQWTKGNTWFKVAIVTLDGNKYAFATNTNITKFGAVFLAEEYKKRWGIETFYRVKDVFRARTTSKNYIIRLFYFMFSVTLYNLWVIVNALLCMFLFGKLPERPLVTAKVIGTLLITIGIP